MKKISSRFLYKELKFFEILVFCALLVVIFVARGLIFAEDPPLAPTILGGTAMTSPVSIQLLWNEASTGVAYFNVEKKLSTDSNYTPLSAPTNMSFNDTAVTAGLSYDYRVQACFTSTLCSDYGVFPTILVPQSGTIPPPPTTFIAGTTLPPVMLTWTMSSTAVSHFNIQKKMSTGSTYNFLTSINYPAMTYTDTAVTAGASYDYQIQACLTGFGCSAYTTLSGVQIPVIIPPAPATLTNGTTMPPVVLNWTMPSGSNVYMFNLQKRVSGGTFSPMGSYGYSVTTATDTSVTAGLSYDYQIQACAYPNILANCSAYTQVLGVLVPGGTNAPVAPTGLMLNGTVTSTSVPLKWTETSTGVTYFSIERKTTSGSFTPVGTVPFSTNPIYSDISIPTSGASYDYRVQACNTSSSCSGYSNTLTVYVPQGSGGGGAPNAPTNLIATVSGSNVVLTWTDNSNDEAGFKIYRGPTWTDIGNAGTNVVTFSDLNRPAGTYTYHINAFNSNYIYSPISNDVSVTIPAGSGGGGGTPNAPTGLMLSGTVTSTSVPLVWTDNSSNEDSFKIYRRLVCTPACTYSLIYTTYPNTTTAVNYSDTGVSPGYYYDYQVQACLGTSCSSYATLAGISVPASGNGQNIPNPPTMLSLVSPATATSVMLHWIDNSYNEDSFKIEKKITGSTTTSFSYIGQVGTNYVNYSDTSGLTPGVYFDYRVQACLLSIGCSTYATLPSVLIPSTGGNGGNNYTIPNAPTNLTATSTTATSGIVLHWTDNATNEDKFNIDRKLSTSTVWTPVTQILQSNQISYNDNSTTFSPGVSYDYRVQACLSGVGCSPYAMLTGYVVYTQTNNTIPAMPTNFIINGNPTYSSIPLKWNDNSNNETGFRIERKLSSAIPFVFVIQTVPNATTFTDVNAGTNLFYDYRIQACNGTICSPFVYLNNVTTLGTTVLPPPLNTTTIIPPTTSSTSSTVPNSSGTQVVPNTSVVMQLATNGTNPNSTTIVPNTPTTQQPTTQIPQNPNTATSQTATSSPEPSPQTNVVVAPTSGVPLQIQNIGLVVEQIQTAIDDTKNQLTKLINDGVAEIVDKASAGGANPDMGAISVFRDEMLRKVNDSFSATLAISPDEVDNLKKEIDKGLENIKSIAMRDTNITRIDTASSGGVSIALNSLSQTVMGQSANITEQGGDLLYKDSNKDGISDYNSIYVYNMDPLKPSPVSSYEGKSINAADKVLLGFDPTKKDLVKVNVEQPVESVAPTVPVYKVEQMALNDKKDVVIKGQALPNSFVTIFIYSTPIMVTVKTDSSGEWQYTLNKELENGDHTIYTATVNNSGNIIAKSPGYLFTKTAEAVSLKDISAVQTTVSANKPGLLGGNSLFGIIMFILGVAITALIFIGVASKKNKEIGEEHHTS